MSRREHWEQVHRRKEPDEVSWYQRDPALSIELVRATGIGASASILDVGGGASLVVDRLLEAGFENLGVLDISSTALESARERLGPASDGVEWIQADVLEYRAAHAWDLWHDRAVFHFLVDPEDRARYRDILYKAVPPGGDVIVATFALTGPTRCSGLETLRCSAEDIARALGGGVELVERRTEAHRTPSGARQDFVYARLRRVHLPEA